MLDLMLAAALMAGAAPKVAYRPDNAAKADVATVALDLPRHPCFGITRATVIVSSAKADRSRIYALSVTAADSPAPEQITTGMLSGQALKVISKKVGDVACTDYQCPTGSSVAFAVDGPAFEAAAESGLTVNVATTAGERCGVPVSVDAAVVRALKAWAEKLPPAKG